MELFKKVMVFIALILVTSVSVDLSAAQKRKDDGPAQKSRRLEDSKVPHIVVEDPRSCGLTPHDANKLVSSLGLPQDPEDLAQRIDQEVPVFKVGNRVVKYSICEDMRTEDTGSAAKNAKKIAAIYSSLDTVSLKHEDSKRPPSPVAVHYDGVVTSPSCPATAEVMQKANGKTLYQLCEQYCAGDLGDRNKIYRGYYKAGCALAEMHCSGLVQKSLGQDLSKWVTRCVHGDGHDSNFAYDADSDSIRTFDCWIAYASGAQKTPYSSFYDFSYSICRILLNPCRLCPWFKTIKIIEGRRDEQEAPYSFNEWKCTVEAATCFAEGYIACYAQHGRDVRMYVINLVKAAIDAATQICDKGRESAVTCTFFDSPYVKTWITPGGEGLRSGLFMVFWNDIFSKTIKVWSRGNIITAHHIDNDLEYHAWLRSHGCPILDCLENRLKYAHIKILDALSKPEMIRSVVDKLSDFVEPDISTLRIPVKSLGNISLGCVVS